MSAKRKFSSYEDVIKVADLPLLKRRKLPIGRGGAMVQPRKFHLSADEIDVLKAEYKETKRIPNPHAMGFYHFLVEALIDLGVNEQHSLGNVLRKVERLMSDESTLDENKHTAWERFESRKPRTTGGKDVQGRAEQNIEVLQRLSGLTPYGRKLLDVGQKVLGTSGMVIDILKAPDSDTKYVRLNTRSARPINEAKTRGFGSPAALKAERAEKREKAKAKAKKRVHKPKVEKAEEATTPEVTTPELVTA
jgi:hypothetical protein